MKLTKVRFRNIRNFFNEVEFDFDTTQKINTISGKNGSGKSTIFKALLLAQKAFFADQIKNNELLVHSIGNELSKYFTNKDSYIELTFAIDEDRTASFKIICDLYDVDYIHYDLQLTENDGNLIREYWNIDKPTDILIYIDSNKHFIEDDISYNNLSISGLDDYNNLLIDTVINPEKIFSNIYNRLIKDYLKERLVPAKPRRDLYFVISKLFLKDLLPQINLSNFTGNHFKGQFILLGKSSGSKKSTFYDIRNFSSGEKVLFYTMLFITYVQEIGMLVIDEPENHFHEELLVKFIKILSEISNAESFLKYITNLAAKHKTNLPNEIEKIYKSYSLSQVFLLTHSKNLIYNNFSSGVNYYVDDSLKEIKYQEYEKTLRHIGISSIYSKVLFVEGTTETDFFNVFFNDFNIKIHALSGCEQVIDTFKKINNVKEHLIDTHFLFIIDKDTRSSDDIKKIEAQDSIQFKESFVVLERHEFENYLLDPEIFETIIRKHYSIYPQLIPLNLSDIKNKIKNIAISKKDHVFKKHLLKLNGNSVGLLNETFRKKDININNESEYVEYVEKKIKEINVEEFLKFQFESNFKICESLYGQEKWHDNWLNLCDGKIVLKETIHFFSKYLGISFDRLTQEIKQTVLENKKFEINKIINDLIGKFEIKSI